MQGPVLSDKAFDLHFLLPLEDGRGEQLLLELLAHVLALDPLFLYLLQFLLNLGLEPSKALHVSLRALEVSAHGDNLLVLLRAHEFGLAYLVHDLLVFGPYFVFNQKLILEILVNLLQLILKQLILLN